MIAVDARHQRIRHGLLVRHGVAAIGVASVGLQGCFSSTTERDVSLLSSPPGLSRSTASSTGECRDDTGTACDFATVQTPTYICLAVSLLSDWCGAIVTSVMRVFRQNGVGGVLHGVVSSERGRRGAPWGCFVRAARCSFCGGVRVCHEVVSSERDRAGARAVSPRNLRNSRVSPWGRLGAVARDRGGHTAFLLGQSPGSGGGSPPSTVIGEGGTR